MKTDNTTAEGLANDTVKQKCSKAIDTMQFYWICDRVRQGQYHVLFWRKAVRHEDLHQSNKARNQNYYDALKFNDCDAESAANSNLEVHFAPRVPI
jgi:hypothetical protein